MSNQLPSYIQWHHAPSHLFLPETTYIVTAACYRKLPLFNTPQKRDFLLNTLYSEATLNGWMLQAWAVMPNHYHFVAQAPENPQTLKKMIAVLHSKTAIWLNQYEKIAGRKVWYRYWDTCISYEKSYLARLNYVHNNPVKHGLAKKAEDYPWCSMKWFLNNSESAFQKTILSFPIGRVSVPDDF
jgi:putative transposase